MIRGFGRWRRASNGDLTMVGLRTGCFFEDKDPMLLAVLVVRRSASSTAQPQVETLLNSAAAYGTSREITTLTTCRPSDRGLRLEDNHLLISNQSGCRSPASLFNTGRGGLWHHRGTALIPAFPAARADPGPFIKNTGRCHNFIHEGSLMRISL